MSYPDLPSNRLIVDGVDLTDTYGLILADGYTLSPPEPKIYTVDIPGGNGMVDITEALLGDVAYKNRKMEFEFYAIDCPDFERLKRNVSSFLHGKAFDYKITMDPEYTYHGRFTITEYSHFMSSQGIIGTIKMEIDADPYKYLPDRIYSINAVGGVVAYFESGRKRVSPIIETENPLKIVFKGKLIDVPMGTWKLNDVTFTEGVNEVYFNSYNIRSIRWSDLKDTNTTWGTFGSKKLYEWYSSTISGDADNKYLVYVFKKWSDLITDTWESLSSTKWADLMYVTELEKEVVDIKNIYVKYEVGEL